MPTEADFLDLQKRLFAVERLLRAGIPTNVVGGGLPDATDGTVFGQIPKTGTPPNEEHGIPEALSTPELGTATEGGGSLKIFTSPFGWYASIGPIDTEEASYYPPNWTTTYSAPLIYSPALSCSFLRLWSAQDSLGDYWSQIAVDDPDMASEGLMIRLRGTQKMMTERSDGGGGNIPEIRGISTDDTLPGDFATAVVGSMFLIVEDPV